MDLLDYLSDIAAMSELEAQAFRYTHNNHVYVINKMWFDLI